MEPKPRGWGADYAAWFDADSVVSRYQLRPPYPAETFTRLAALAVGTPRAVLDAGCGTGELARGLAPLVDRVDAVDRSAAMLATGRTLEGGDAPNIGWIKGDIERVELRPAYGLIAAGESVHWFDWQTAMRRFAELLPADGMLAIVYRDWLGPPELRGRLVEVYGRHGANPDFEPLDPIHELERRGLFETVGKHATTSQPWTPTAAQLIGCHHSQNGFVLERMRDPAGFAAELLATVESLAGLPGGRFNLDVTATITWGRPRPR